MPPPQGYETMAGAYVQPGQDFLVLILPVMKTPLVHISVRRARRGRGFHFSGGIQIAHHSADGHGADAESVEENAELHLHPVRVRSSRGRCLGQRLTTEIQRLQRNTKHRISTISKWKPSSAKTDEANAQSRACGLVPRTLLDPSHIYPWCDASAGTEGRNALLQAHRGL